MDTRKYSNLQEKRIAKKLHGRKQLNSGATMFQKGDVITDKILIECKTKVKESKSISIQKDWIEKLKEEAFAMRLVATFFKLCNISVAKSNLF